MVLVVALGCGSLYALCAVIFGGHVGIQRVVLYVVQRSRDFSTYLRVVRRLYFFFLKGVTNQECSRRTIYVVQGLSLYRGIRLLSVGIYFLSVFFGTKVRVFFSISKWNMRSQGVLKYRVTSHAYSLSFSVGSNDDLLPNVVICQEKVRVIMVSGLISITTSCSRTI